MASFSRGKIVSGSAFILFAQANLVDSAHPLSGIRVQQVY